MRIDAKIGVNELGRRIGISGAAVSSIESGKYSPRVETLAAWVSACGITEADMEMLAAFAHLMVRATPQEREDLRAQIQVMLGEDEP
jgi:transcriptional regulator with XRE-family HTH domain